MSRCIICNQDININLKVSPESQSPSRSTQQQDEDDQNKNTSPDPKEFLSDSQNNRLVFKTFCKYFKISSGEWEELCDNFLSEATSKTKDHVKKKLKMKMEKRGNTSESNDNEEIDMDIINIPVPFCDECSALVKSLSELDKMFQTIQWEISKMFSNLLTLVLTTKNGNDNNSCKSMSEENANSPTQHYDIDEIFGSEITRLRNCIYQQYTPRLILHHLKSKSLSSTPSENIAKLKKSTTTTKNKKNVEESYSPSQKRKRRSIRTRKTSRFHTRRAQVKEIVDLIVDQEESLIKNTNNNNITMENPDSPHCMDIDDDYYCDEDPLFFNQEEEEQEEILDDVQVHENNEEKNVKIKVCSLVKSVENFNPTIINYSSSNSPFSTTIKIEPEETEWTTTTNTSTIANTTTTTPDDSNKPTKSRKAKKEALLKIKHKIEQLSTFDINLNKNKNKANKNSPSSSASVFGRVKPQILDEIELDSDGECVYEVDDDEDDNYNCSEYESSHDENEGDDVDKVEEEDWRASFGYSAAPNIGCGGKKRKNKKSKVRAPAKKPHGRTPGAQNKKTKLPQKSTETNPNNDNDNNDNTEVEKRPNLVFYYKNQSCEKWVEEDGETWFKCSSCGFTTRWRNNLNSHIQVAHVEGIYLQCIYCRGGKYSSVTFPGHLRQRHADKPRRDVVIPCGPNLFYYNRKLFEKIDAGFKCLEDGCHEIVKEFNDNTSSSTTTTITNTTAEIENSSQISQDNINNTNEEPAQISAGENQNESKQVESRELEKEPEIQLQNTLVKGTQNIIEHLTSVHILKVSDERTRMENASRICDICGGVFTSAWYLKRHVSVIHSEERPFICETCGMSFKEASRLRVHQKIHKAPGVFTCTINGCGKTYTMKRYLNKHIASDYHTEGKNYSCSICEQQGGVKKFHQLFGLKRHMRNHEREREKNAKCPECDKGFYTKWEVRQHLIRCPVLLDLQLNDQPSEMEMDSPQE